MAKLKRKRVCIQEITETQGRGKNKVELPKGYEVWLWFFDATGLPIMRENLKAALDITKWFLTSPISTLDELQDRIKFLEEGGQEHQL